MILLLADSTDPWAIMIHRELCRRARTDLAWIPPSKILDRIELNWPVTNGTMSLPGSLIVDGKKVALEELTGIFLRTKMPLPLALDELSTEDRGYVVKESTAAWMAFLNAVPCGIVNPPMPGGRPALLGGQLVSSQLALKHGFLTLPSRCTSSKSDALSQYATWNGRVYLKAIGSSESGRLLQPEDAEEQICRVLEQHAVSMQPVPEGALVTVYVVDSDEAMATADKDAHRGIGGLWLPMGRCFGVAAALGLRFAECRIFVTPEGRAYCLEVGGDPGFWQCPQDTQQQVVGKLADYLSQPRSVSPHDSLNGTDGRLGAGERLREVGRQEC